MSTCPTKIYGHELLLWKYLFHSSTTVPETCKIDAKRHYSCSGSSWRPNTLLRHFMLGVFIHLHVHFFSSIVWNFSYSCLFLFCFFLFIIDWWHNGIYFANALNWLTFKSTCGSVAVSCGVLDYSEGDIVFVSYVLHHWVVWLRWFILSAPNKADLLTPLNVRVFMSAF